MKIEGEKRIETEVLHFVRRIFPKTDLLPPDTHTYKFSC